jgi:hypothetical protein
MRAWTRSLVDDPQTPDSSSCSIPASSMTTEQLIASRQWYHD